MTAEKKGYVISTETTCDMDRSYYMENGINLLGMTYTLGDREYDSASEDTLASKEFYQLVRQGAMPKTAQVPVEKAAFLCGAG